MLAVNTFGFFINQPALLPPFPGLEDVFPAQWVEVEFKARFPWRGGRHPSLDAVAETATHFIGIESKRYEPFRDSKSVNFSDAYSRPVWGERMGSFEKMRDDLKTGAAQFHYLDATQLVKHAFGLVAEGVHLSQQLSRLVNVVRYLASSLHARYDSREYRRHRRTRSPWRCTDVNGETLALRNFSTKLTQTVGFRGTLCNVRERDYLLRRINGEEEPRVLEALALQSQLIDMAERLIADLHWRDFEILVDRIFGDAGWRRVGVLGETQADVDLIVEQTVTGERAFVQVKSQATPAVFHDYVDRFREYGDCSRMFFICHSPKGRLHEQACPPDVEMWLADIIARKAIRAGQYDWLVQRVR